MHSTFEIKGSIALVAEGKYLDLHNCFAFIGYEYRPAAQQMWLRWRRGMGQWISNDLPMGLVLTFSEVTNVSVLKRDDETPFSEDDCLASITFLPAALNDHYEAVCFDERFPDEHLSLGFQSGAAIKIWAGKGEHGFSPV